MLHFWAVIIKTICPYTNYVKNKTKMFIFNLFSSAFLIFNFLRFLPCILLQRLFYYGSEAIEWFILLNYCVNPFDFSLETYLDLVLTKKNRTKLSFIQCTVLPGHNSRQVEEAGGNLLFFISFLSIYAGSASNASSIPDWVSWPRLFWARSRRRQMEEFDQLCFNSALLQSFDKQQVWSSRVWRCTP